jgi:uncharacterized protein (TIGR02145 family)
MGTVLSGTFSGINWGKNAKFLQVEMDPAGGTTYTDLGTTQMMSVPYALQANAIKMRTSASGDTLHMGGGNYLIIPGISNANPTYQADAPVTDIDGNVYQTIRVGTQIWMKDNLKVSKYRNGNSISTGHTASQWSNLTSGAYTHYNNDLANNSIFGKLYNWYAITDTRGLCPAGWHVPTDPEWSTLENFLGGYLVAGGKLKSTSPLWNSPNTGATDIVGFSGIPGGAVSETSSYFDLYYGSYWWSSSAYSQTLGWFHFSHTSNTASNRNGLSQKCGLSVRCIKD